MAAAGQLQPGAEHQERARAERVPPRSRHHGSRGQTALLSAGERRTPKGLHDAFQRETLQVRHGPDPRDSRAVQTRRRKARAADPDSSSIRDTHACPASSSVPSNSERAAAPKFRPVRPGRAVCERENKVGVADEQVRGRRHRVLHKGVRGHPGRGSAGEQP